MPTFITAYRSSGGSPKYCLNQLPGYVPVGVKLDATMSVRINSVGVYLVSQGQRYSLAEALALGLARIIEPTDEEK